MNAVVEVILMILLCFGLLLMIVAVGAMMVSEFRDIFRRRKPKAKAWEQPSVPWSEFESTTWEQDGLIYRARIWRDSPGWHWEHQYASKWYRNAQWQVDVVNREFVMGWALTRKAAIKAAKARIPQTVVLDRTLR